MAPRHLLLAFVLVLLLSHGQGARLSFDLSSVWDFTVAKVESFVAGWQASQLATPAEELPGADFPDGDDALVRTHWAVVIAGSSGWGNYRHQADVCHAYQVLRRGGLTDAHIVVMMYDDIAGNSENPHPGEIYNKPGGENVYLGVPRDYTGEDVNSQVFLAVLSGDRRAVMGKGSGKVIASGPHDRVFVFYSDHGAAGILGMPAGPFLYADELVTTLHNKSLAGGFKEMVLYIEACESGSMFEGLLPANIHIYATTAANAIESSWGTYCPGMEPPPPQEFSTCLGDLYSVAWMENAELADLTKETIHDQVGLVTARTSNNFTYIQGSHVMQYGQLAIQREKAGDYEGMLHSGPATAQQQQPAAVRSMMSSAATVMSHLEMANRRNQDSSELPGWTQVEQRSADLVPLQVKAQRARDPAVRAAAQAELEAQLAYRQAAEAAVRDVARRLLLHPASSALLMTNLGWTQQQVFMAAHNSGNRLSPSDQYVELLVAAPLQDRPSSGKALVDDWDCLRAHMNTWQDVCGPMDQYTMKFSRFFANLCNAGVSAGQLRTGMRGANCAAAPQ